jgi:signal peptidase II
LKRYITPAIVVFLVLLFDQALKFYIKLHYYLNESISVSGNWFNLHFVENPGMAFGMTLGGSYGKLMLSFFRIGAVVFIGYYLINLVEKKANKGLIASIALILAGAVGNIIDSVFYGVIFSDSRGQLAQLFPVEGGYAGWFHGKVVDMLSIHVFTIDNVPHWLPLIGGEPFIFFGPIFNIADAAITVGVFLIIIFQKRFFEESSLDKSATAPTIISTPSGDTIVRDEPAQ